MQGLKKRINVISGTWTPGTTTAAMSADTALRALDERPAGKYAYVKGIRARARCTIAETKGGAGVAFPVEDQIQMARSLKLEHDGNPRMTALSFLDVARLIQQGQEVHAPDLVASYLPIADLATGSGAVSVTLDFVIPLAPALYKRGASQRSKYTGMISAASLRKSGKLEFLGASAANMTGGGVDYWSCTSIAVDVWLEMVYLDYPVEAVLVREEIVESSINTIQAAGELGERRLLASIVTDDTDGDMTANNGDGVITIDSKVVDTAVSSAELITETNELRLDGVNDYLPACIPMVTLANHDLEECPIIHSTYKLERMNSGHAGSYHLLTRQSARPDLNTQIQLLRLQKVPQAAIDAYRKAVEARSQTEAYEEIGLAVRVLKSEVARGVQEYL